MTSLAALRAEHINSLNKEIEALKAELKEVKEKAMLEQSGH